MENIMNRISNRIRKFRPTAVIAMLALFIAIGGTATAASGLINGSKIKNNSVAGKKLKNKTITKKKLAPATIKALKGKQGPKGNPGADGVVAPTYTEFQSVNLPANTELAIGTVNVPAGKYLVTATSRVFSNGTAIMGCGLSANNGGGFSESATWSSPAASSRTTLPLQMVTESSEVTQITLGCHPGDTNGAADGTLIVTPVQ
jgi:hypothetical protein